MNNFFFEEDGDLNIVRTLSVGNAKAGALIVVSFRKNKDKELERSINMGLIVGGVSKDSLDEYIVKENEYHVEYEDSMLDIVVSLGEISIGFSCGDESTVQTISVKE